MTSRTFDIRRSRRRQGGVALILTLLVLSVLVVVVVQFSYAVKVEKTVVQNGLEDQALMVAARGVMPYLGTLFRDDAKDPNASIKDADTLADAWSDKNLADKLHKLKVGDIDLEFRCEDLERRFPLEWLADDRRAQFALETLNRLLAKLQVENPDDVGTKIANKVRELAGKEALAAPQPGQPLPPPAPPVQPPTQPGQEPPAKRALFSVEQLLDTDGVDKLDEILYGDPKAQPNPKPGLVEFVTCWPTGSININTCRGELMVAFLPKQTKPIPAAGGGATTQPQPIDVEALAKKIRARRIDPAYEQEQQSGASGGATPTPAPPPPPPPAGPPSGGGTGGGSGASKGWSTNSKAFAQVAELGQFEELKGYFPQAAGGTPGAPPPPPPPPPGSGGVQAFDFTQALSTTSRFYAVHVRATAPSGNFKVVRLVVARNKQNLVAPLLVREEPK